MTSKIKTTAILISATLVALFGATVAASAANTPAYAKSALNVRTGPGVNYNKVDTLYAGENVMVRECQRGWCYVDHSGPDGWVSANYLAQRGVTNPNIRSTPSVNFSMTFGARSGPSVSFSVGSGAAPAPAPVTPKVCFYRNQNYNGSSFCVAPGTSNNALMAGWNNSISSIRVFGGAKVQLCKNWNFSGRCAAYNTNIARLPNALNNKVSSYQTWL